MSRPGPPHSPSSFSPRLPARAAGVPLRPAGSLDRIEVTVHYSAWDVYRMELAERWRRSHSADAPVIASTFPFAVILYLLLDIFYVAFAPGAWKDTILVAALWLLVRWALGGLSLHFSRLAARQKPPLPNFRSVSCFLRRASKSPASMCPCGLPGPASAA